MKKLPLLSLLVLTISSACKHKPHCYTTKKDARGREYKVPCSQGMDFIPVDSANKMVDSYLSSIHYEINDTDIRSITFNADDLRLLLDNHDVKQIQVRMAHTLAYINNGNSAQVVGYKSGALTFLISGVDEKGDEVMNESMILNNGRPCPNDCPFGSASNPFY